jgi:2-haloacid dehalogenase
MPPTPLPKAILFDVFGTVVDWRTSLITGLSAWGAAKYPHANWPQLADKWRAAYVPSMNQVRSGQRPWANLDTLQRESLRALAPTIGLPATLPADDETHIVTAWHRLTPWPDSVPGLTRLKQATIIAPLSNGNVALLVNMAKHAALPWDAIFATELFRHYKPDPETYRGATALLGLAPHQVLMAAAHNTDLAAAKSCGLRTAFIPRPTEYGPHQTQDQSPTHPWDHTAASIEHLASQLGL